MYLVKTIPRIRNGKAKSKRQSRCVAALASASKASPALDKLRAFRLNLGCFCLSHAYSTPFQVQMRGSSLFLHPLGCKVWLLDWSVWKITANVLALGAVGDKEHHTWLPAGCSKVRRSLRLALKPPLLPNACYMWFWPNFIFWESYLYSTLNVHQSRVQQFFEVLKSVLP